MHFLGLGCEMVAALSAPISDDSYRFVPDSGQVPRSPRRKFSPIVRLIVALVVWGLVIVIELKDFRNISLIVPVVEAGIWITALASVVVPVWRSSRRLGRALGLLTAIIGAVLFTHFTNWSMYEPRSY